MTLSSRLGDYGITGAFFLVAQLIALLVADPAGSQEHIRAVLAYLQQLVSMTPSLSTPFASLLAALALILVFFVGLVIDLLGFYAPTLEIVAFRRRLEIHSHWLRPLLDRHNTFLGEDIKTLVDEYKPARSVREALKTLMTTMPFSRKARNLAKTNYSALFRIGAYQRILDFLLILALESANSSTAEALQDNLRVWRTSRAIATVIFFLAFEIAVLPFIFRGLTPVVFPLALQGAYIGCLLLALGLAVRSFRQLCEAIFAVLYLNGGGEGEQSAKEVSDLPA